MEMVAPEELFTGGVEYGQRDHAGPNQKCGRDRSLNDEWVLGEPGMGDEPSCSTEDGNHRGNGVVLEVRSTSLRPQGVRCPLLGAYLYQFRR